jgi:hypothetical protein
MSHINPNLYKRIGLMDLEYLLVKGKSKASDILRFVPSTYPRNPKGNLMRQSMLVSNGRPIQTQKMFLP